MDELSEEEPDPSAPHLWCIYAWNPSDAMLEKAKGPIFITKISFIIMIGVANWRIGTSHYETPNLNILEPWSHYLQI